MPELPSGLVVLPAQRSPQDDVAPAVAPAGALADGLAGEPGHDGTQPAAGAPVSIAAASPWFDWRRARGAAADPEADEDPEPDADPEQDPASAAGTAPGPGGDAAEAGEPVVRTRAFPWFSSTAS